MELFSTQQFPPDDDRAPLWRVLEASYVLRSGWQHHSQRPKLDDTVLDQWNEVVFELQELEMAFQGEPNPDEAELIAAIAQAERCNRELSRILVLLDEFLD
jgi:hypothetical protein